jgi:hypothetical protein
MRVCLKGNESTNEHTDATSNHDGVEILRHLLGLEFAARIILGRVGEALANGGSAD